MSMQNFPSSSHNTELCHSKVICLYSCGLFPYEEKYIVKSIMLIYYKSRYKYGQTGNEKDPNCVKLRASPL